jgi:hypothetical protein
MVARPGVSVCKAILRTIDQMTAKSVRSQTTQKGYRIREIALSKR